MNTIKQGLLVIYSSPNGREPWTPVLPADVPAWVKAYDNMARLVDGEMCCKNDEGDAGSLWYRAEEIKTPAPTVQ